MRINYTKLGAMIFSAILFTGCGKTDPEDMVLPPGARFVKEIGQRHIPRTTENFYTVEVMIDDHIYLWVYREGTYGRYGTLCPKLGAK